MEKKLISKLSQIIKRDPGFAAQVASTLGYRSTGTIKNWVTRKKIPLKQIPALQSMIQYYQKENAA